MKNLNRHLNLKHNSYNKIGDKGAAKLSEGISKLVNLCNLNLNLA
jgi:hypothetical protein